MALGTLGSTLNDELNRLANGGTYRDMNQMVDEALAAKQWANRENINPYSTDTVGILNEIAGLGLDKRNWLDFNGVCNYIAGTTGLPAAAALRQVYPTTDLLTGVASYYVDAVNAQIGGGYLLLPGVAGNYASAPDSSALDITGDIDIRVKASLDSWYSTTQILCAKRTAASSQFSFAFYVASDGALFLAWSENGTSALTANSTVPLSLVNGATKWVRVTMDVDNGASGSEIKFWTSDDNVTWTQLGSTVLRGTITSIFNSTAVLEIGSQYVGTNSPAKGEFFNTQIYASINGTALRFDANFETAMTSQTVASFTESSSNAATVTINRTTYNFQLDTINNLGTAGSLLPTTLGSSTAADSNDPKFLDHTGTNYVYAVGSAGNNLSVPDAANLRITGDIDIRVQVAMDDWTPAAAQFFAGKYGASGNRAWTFGVLTNGRLYADFSLDGTAVVSPTSSVATGITDGTSKWVRVTRIASTGVVKFFTSDDAITWTQLGTDVSSTSGNIFASTNAVSFAHYTTLNTGDGLVGKFYRGQVLNGIDGTTVLDVDTSVITAGSATSFTAVTGQTVTINRSTSGRKTVAVTQPTWLFGTDDYMEVNNRYMSSGTYLYLPGVASNYASAPDSAALDITGDIDLRVKVALDDWTPAATNTLIGKRSNTTTQQSYVFSATPTGGLSFGWSTAGTTLIAQNSIAHSIPDGTTKWVRVTLDVDNGAGGYDVKFFLSDDGTNWTQLGTTITGVGTTSIFDSTAALEVGAQVSGLSSVVSRGKFFRAQVLNGIGGTVAFDANFETSITSLNQASFTESSANAATVTINRSGSAYRSAGITAAGYLYPGATNTFTASATDYLNFGASDSFTLVAASRVFGASGVNNERFLSKGTTANVGSLARYTLRRTASANTANVLVSDGTNQANPTSTESISTGAQFVESAVINRSTQVATLYLNATQSATASTSTVGSLSNLATFGIGGALTSDALAGEIYAAAVFRQALSIAQIRQISNYFANREVYL